MKALIVLTHPEPTSFCGALAAAATEVVRAAGHEAELSDLHAQDFNPAAGRHDFTSVAEPRRFHYQTEQLHASANHGFAPEIAREQARLAEAGLLILVFPLWWGGVPAMLKGWFDRVCAYGFAYADGRRFDTGFFRGRDALMAVTTGGTAERFSADGVYGEMRHVLHGAKHCMLEYLGFEVPEPFVAYAAPRVDAASREAYLLAWRARVGEAVTRAATRDAATLAATLAEEQSAALGNAGWQRA
jgi:NAD(P)H dehydrogenase (quinone)